MASAAKKVRKVCIENEMTIYTAAETRAKLTEAGKKNFEVELDLAHVSELDTAGLQLLVWAKREFMAGGGNLYLVNHSQAVYEVLDLCNMIRFFGDSIVLPSKQSERSKS